MANFLDYRERLGTDSGKVFKSTLFQGARLLIGLNCLEPGQSQGAHTHSNQDKFYFVLEGEGEFIVGEERREVGVGCTVWAAAGVQHGVTNNGGQQLVLLVGIAPSPNL